MALLLGACCLVPAPLPGPDLADDHRSGCTLGVAWLLGSSSIAYVVQDAVGRELPLFYALSLIVFAVCALMSVSAWQALSPVVSTSKTATPSGVPGAA